MFGLPKVIQTDQGSNFMSRIVAQVLKQLAISHIHLSVYHPESQGAHDFSRPSSQCYMHTAWNLKKTGMIEFI